MNTLVRRGAGVIPSLLAVVVLLALCAVSGCHKAVDTTSQTYRDSFKGDPSRMPKDAIPKTTMPAGAPAGVGAGK